MSFGDDVRWGDDPRERGDDPREIEIHRVTIGRRPSGDMPEAAFDARERLEHDPRDMDPRDPFVEALTLPRDLERELVVDGRDRYELNGDDSRAWATIGAFRVVRERDFESGSDTCRELDLEPLRDEGLVRFVSLDEHERAVTLTESGLHLLDTHRRDEDGDGPSFYADVSRPRELQHDAQLYGAYREVQERLREDGGDVRGLTLEQDLKREYQEWLQAHNRDHPDSDGRPDRSAREIEQWALQHDLPYFDGSVHFPDFQIEYVLDGRERHENVEVVTRHYRGAHAASRVRAGFTCISRGTRSGKRGGRPFDPRLAEEIL